MPTPSQLITIATRHQAHLERLKAGLAGDFAGALAGVGDTVAAILLKLDADTFSDLSRSALETALSRLEKAQGEIFDAAVNRFMPKLLELADYEGGFEKRSLETVVSRKFKQPSAKVLFAAAKEKPLQAVGEKLEPFINGWSRQRVKRVNGVIVTGYEQGKTVQQLVTQIRGTKKANYRDGIVATTAKEAQAVAHTAVQHVASTARLTIWEENKDVVEGYEFVATLDRKTTSQCRSLDGRKFKLGKGPFPPLHIRCRSTTVASLTPDLDFLLNGTKRASELGPVDAGLTYYDWLKKQPEAFQISVLGPTRTKLLRRGGLTASRFAALQLDRNFEPLTLAEMRKLEPAAFDKAGI